MSEVDKKDNHLMIPKDKTNNTTNYGTGMV